MQANLTFNTAAVAKAMAQVSKKMPDTIAYALTGCAFEGRKELMDKLKHHIDRPAPATARGVYYKKALPTPKPFSEVGFSPLAWKWMKYHVIGGSRAGPTLSAPVGAMRNQYGNTVSGQRESKMRGASNTFRKKINGTEGLWQVGKGSIKLLHVYRPGMRYEPRLPMQKIVYDRAAKVFPEKFKESVKKSLGKMFG